ncbi:MaoC family dehydratase [Planosporangium thailandense]|uniref:MaoC family dehydratase n=1 Tax=Planosporangium thailandense TaxID=765197 RepID=A0ABX0Y507_9ACTN|nr:MaoC family dehydratase [Planosporangium thailandense]NJC73423.1 MaoC family dehydratase [Planosporangium thailandense]
MTDDLIGRTVTFSKTVSESDVYLFAGISGDLSPNHVDEEYMKRTPYGRRIAHGALMVAYMSACSTKFVESIGNDPHVSYGYDRIRFTRPVFLGDTVRIEYTIAESEPQRRMLRADVRAYNQDGEVVAVATHILKGVA